MASTNLSHLMYLIDYTTISLLSEIEANGFHQLEDKGRHGIVITCTALNLPDQTYKPMFTIKLVRGSMQ